MALGRLWAGRIYGTSTGNVFVRLDGDELALNGTLHLKEPSVGVVVYSIRGAFDGNQLSLRGEPQQTVEGSVFGQLTATATLNNRGELVGEWNTNVGSAGTFILFPHEIQTTGVATSREMPDQLHTARSHFGAVEVNREQITALAHLIQREFKKAEVVVTVAAGTEQSRFLSDFETAGFNVDRVKLIKLFVQEPEGNGINRVAQVEFGPQVNMVMTQGSDEAWVLGMLEKLKGIIRPFERAYTTNFKRFGFGINQLLLVGTIVFLPSLESLLDRVILMIGVLTLIFCVNWLHGKYLPFAAIYLGQKPRGVIAKFAPTAISWIIAVTAGIVATLLAAYLQGWLNHK